MNKLPQITLAFWVMKICATTLGETAGDLLSMTLNVGYAISSLILISVFVLTLITQLMSKTYKPLLDRLGTTTKAVTVDVNPEIGKAFGDEARLGHVDMVKAWRSPGSTLKPFLYAMAFDQQLLTPASLLEDAPLEVATPTGLYRPHNYDEQFRDLVGHVTGVTRPDIVTLPDGRARQPSPQGRRDVVGRLRGRVGRARASGGAEARPH